MVLLAYTIFTTTLVLQRKEASRGARAGPGDAHAAGDPAAAPGRPALFALIVAVPRGPAVLRPHPARGPRLAQRALSAGLAGRRDGAHPAGTLPFAQRTAATAGERRRSTATIAAAARGAPDLDRTETNVDARAAPSRPARSRRVASRRPSTSPTGTRRAGRRETARRRYERAVASSSASGRRSLVIGVVARGRRVGAFVFTSAAAAAYACTTIDTVQPAASGELGQVQPRHGQPPRRPRGDKVTYPVCPPASGQAHQPAAATARSRPRSTGPTTRPCPTAGCTTSSTAASCSSTRATRAPATTRRSQQLQALLRRASPRAPSAACRRGRSARSSRGSSRCRPSTRPSSGTACCTWTSSTSPQIYDFFTAVRRAGRQRRQLARRRRSRSAPPPSPSASAGESPSARRPARRPPRARRQRRAPRQRRARPPSRQPSPSAS